MEDKKNYMRGIYYQRQMNGGEAKIVDCQKYNLEKRVIDFGARVVKFSINIYKNVVSVILLRQLVRSATSVGANYFEAVNAQSKKDFIHKMGICCKEIKEVVYWMTIIEKSITTSATAENVISILKEANELNLIFSKSVLTAKKNLCLINN